VARDIAKGFITSDMTTADNMNNSCYGCLFSASCLDDSTGDTGNECADLTGTVGNGPMASETKTQSCLYTLACILGAPSEGGYTFPGGSNSCGNMSTDGISNCYCGSNYTTTPACNGASGVSSPAANGPCEQVELDGLGLTTATSGSTVLGALTVKTSGSGMANAILKCAGTNAGAGASCTMCFQ
jgi:hypothetical protein